MLTQLFPFLDPAHITPDLARRLHALADDCDRLERGCAVSPILLRVAPLLEDWLPAMTPEGVQLIGYASGHPVHGDRRVMTTPCGLPTLMAPGFARCRVFIGSGRPPILTTFAARISVANPALADDGLGG